MLDTSIIVVYFLIVFAIGFYHSRRERTSSDYFLAGQNVGWFAVGASLFATNISSEHFIGLAGSGASTGLAVGCYEWSASFCLFLLGWLFVPHYLQTPRVHDAGVSREEIQPGLPLVSDVGLDLRVYLH